jgi:4-amino-4-deoxy-L-arabinose transferase-like glycosyltransferase
MAHGQHNLRMQAGDDLVFSSCPGRLAEALLFIALLSLILLRAHPWDCLVGYDQAKQAYASLEMIQDGSGWYPHLPTGHPATKPPLMGWISAALYAISGGWWEGAWRLPSLLAFFVTLSILKRAARRAGGAWGAYAAAGVLAVNMFTIRMATLVRTDMLLAMLIFAGGVLIWHKIRGDAAWTWRSRLLLAGIVLASCFTKGPVVFVYLLLPLLVWRWLVRRRPDAARAWSGWSPWLIPAAIFFLWIFIGRRLDPQFFQMVVLREFGGNFAAVTVDGSGHALATGRHFSMILTYPLQLLHRLFPWSIVLVAWAVVDRDGRRRLMADRGSRWLLVWFSVSVLLMSLVPNKRADRIFPVVPPLALLFASAIRAASWRARPAWNPRRIIYALTVVAVLLWGGYAAFTVLKDSGNRERSEERARRDFCVQVRAWEHAQKRSVKVVGPVSDREQSLLVYLRRTTWLSRDDMAKELARGSALLAPLNELTSHPCVIVLSPPAPGRVEGCYALGVETSIKALKEKGGGP